MFSRTRPDGYPAGYGRAPDRARSAGIGTQHSLPPALLVADELSLGLAPIVAEEVFSTLQSIRASGSALLVIEQQVNRALDLADRAVLLHKGRGDKSTYNLAVVHLPDSTEGEVLPLPDDVPWNDVVWMKAAQGQFTFLFDDGTIRTVYRMP